jgi:hypothetical protein
MLYTTNSEYRAFLRQIFQMDSQKYKENIQKLENNNKEILDEETLDEISYDEDAAAKIMDEWYCQTANNSLFHTIYDLAAAKMISTNREIGFAVLFSYDFLHFFYPVLMEFLQNSGEFNNTSPAYCALITFLS